MVVSVTKIDKNLDRYDTIDSSLVSSRDYIRQFGLPEDYVEYHIYTKGEVLLSSNYTYKGYKIPGNLKSGESTFSQEIQFYPETILEELGYTYGSYLVQFNVYRKKIVDLNEKVFFIKEISPDRKELRVSSNILSSLTIQDGVVNFINEIQTASFYKDFLLNFGENKLVNAVNIALDKNTDPYSVLIKLYEPLPKEFDLKSSFWVVEELSEAITYEVQLAPNPVEEVIPLLRSANFDVEIDEHSITPSPYTNIDELYSNKSLTAYQELLNSVNKKGVYINVDYSDYSNFVHFSSAAQRLLNFKYKIELLESYTADINSIKATTNYNTSYNSSASISSLQNKADSIIKNFDGYESYLYYNSESNAWPKSNSTKPYVLYSSTSSQALTWFGSYDYSSPYYGGQYYTASSYDLENQDNLIYTIPEYISIDPVNDGYSLFLSMVGQHFDNIWIYEKSITDLWKNNNNLYKGVSKDLVYYALRSLGIKIYNSKSNDDIYQYLIGSSLSGSFFPTGSNLNTLVTASSYSVAGQDIQKEILKRLYHNIPYLLKSKGTNRGIEALISTFGITGSILQINEFGGTNKSSSINAAYSLPNENKVRIVNNSITGSVLSPFLRLETPDPYYTKDIHFLEIGFSPQNEINNDFSTQYSSSFNIDQYIGDPRDDYKNTYPDLTSFTSGYYSKYIRRYNLKDYVRLIQFFDNSLFKMIKDYVPARTNAQTGLVIKSPAMERSKTKKVKSVLDENYLSYESEIKAGQIEANSIYTSGNGDGTDFYRGELSGSSINVYSIFEIKNRNPYL